MSLLDLLRTKPVRLPCDDLYRAAVAIARQPRWYVEGQVPDSVDGRFDMVALVTSVLLVRLERDADPKIGVALTERFIDDMDGSLRELGIGDMVIGKHVGRTVSALGGRLGAYRAAMAGTDGETWRSALARNLYRGAPPDDAVLDWTVSAAVELAADIDAVALDALLAGTIA